MGKGGSAEEAKLTDEQERKLAYERKFQA